MAHFFNVGRMCLFIRTGVGLFATVRFNLYRGCAVDLIIVERAATLTHAQFVTAPFINQHRPFRPLLLSRDSQCIQKEA